VPELPEVETVVRDLRPMVVGRRIGQVVRPSRLSLRSPWQPEWDGQLRGQTIHAVERRGKWIILRLDGESSLVVHLGMTGQFTVVPAEGPIDAHTHLIFPLEGGRKKAGARQLRFRDSRRFGSARLFATEADVKAFFVEAGLGPEPFDLVRIVWRRRLQETSRCIKAVLLDQQVVAGVGNIYADEALFEARLHPATVARELTPTESDRLRSAITNVLRRAIEQRGSSIRDYIGGSGQRGGYQDEFRVYGRTGKACRRCKTAIASVRLGGRTAHYCPACQPAPEVKAQLRQEQEKE
jgi:formamidopyrimidine-DNA glycosylase